MKKQWILLTLVMALMISMVTIPNTGKASADTMPSYDYMILGNAVYESTTKSTLSSELALAQKSKKPKANETFSDKTEKRMNGAWVKFSHSYNTLSGFKASSYYNPSRNEVVIAFAGTTDVLDWVSPSKYKTYGTILAANGHKQRTYAKNYALKIAKDISNKDPKNHVVYKNGKKINPSAKIVMTGHSLGGYLVQVAGMQMMDDKNKATREQFKIGYTFNSLGIALADVGKTQWNSNKKGKYSKFFHFGTTPEFVGMYNEASFRILAGTNKNRTVAYVKEISPSTGIYGLHGYKALYRHFKWE